MSRPKQDERGAIAIMFALLSVILLIVSAFAVDLGNAYAHKRERQKDTDHATLAGAGIAGANLPAAAVSRHLYLRQQGCGHRPGRHRRRHLPEPGSSGQTVSPGDLADCDVSDGEVFYGEPTKTSAGWSLAYNKNQLSRGVAAGHRQHGLRRRHRA